MKNNRVEFVWGVVLVLLGMLFLAETMGWIPALTAVLWSVVFGAASVMFFVTFLVRGMEEWGWLFPAAATGAIAAIIWLSESGFDGAWLGSLILWAVSLPFWVVFVANRQKNWWALIPGWVTAVIGFIVLLADRVSGEWIGALIMFAIGLPFFIVYLRNRQHWWALIPGFTLSVIGVVILLSTAAPEEMVGFVMMAAISFPFFFIYFRSRQNWWAIIPAGVMGSIAVVVLLSTLISGSEFLGRESIESRLIGSLLFLGWSATFGVLWMRRQEQPTDWAKYPAVALLGLAALSVILGPQMENMWAVALIVVGLWLLVDNFRRPSLKGG